jgi:hypothetical protein
VLSDLALQFGSAPGLTSLSSICCENKIAKYDVYPISTKNFCFLLTLLQEDSFRGERDGALFRFILQVSFSEA